MSTAESEIKAPRPSTRRTESGSDVARYGGTTWNAGPNARALQRSGDAGS